MTAPGFLYFPESTESAKGGDEERETGKTALLVFAEHKNLNSKENMDNE